MLNLQKACLELDATMAAFVEAIVSLLADKPKVNPRQKTIVPQPAPRRSLLDRPNVVVFRSNALPVALTAPTPEPSPPQETSSEDLADSVTKAVLASAMPLTLEQLRARLRTARDTLTPVVEQLVTESKLRVIELDGVVAYKPPRIEPIRRRRMTA